MRLIDRIQILALGALALLLTSPALAATDKRAVQGASTELAPVIPEPSSILLFAAGVAVVGYGVRRRLRS